MTDRKSCRYSDTLLGIAAHKIKLIVITYHRSLLHKQIYIVLHRTLSLTKLLIHSYYSNNS